MKFTHGQFNWNELMTRDVAGMKKFYTGALGWKFEKFPGPMKPPYWLIKVDGKGIGGFFDISDKHFKGIKEQWVTYVAVDDVDKRVKKALKLGAKLMRPALDIPNVGRIAFLIQPGGAIVAWMTPKM
jgi:predicted enzyme related to lactoylglutathione lyase